MNTYTTHDNGGRPFCVEVNGNHVNIFMTVDIDSVNTKRGTQHFSFDTETIWIGDNTYPVNQTKHYEPNGRYPGNSILLHLKGNQYIFVGDSIFSFKTAEPILEYHSPIGNSDVPYPYAISETAVYFMLEKKWMARDQLDMNEDLYGQLYAAKGRDTHPLSEVKILHARRW